MTQIIIDSGQAPDQAFSDAARHCADAVNIHVTVHGAFGAIGKWVAVRLADGKSDGMLYDTKGDAVKHQLHEMMCAYVCITPGGMTPADAESYLRTHRKLYEAGYRLADPDKHVVMKS
jgi:hypothetical protein